MKKFPFLLIMLAASACAFAQEKKVKFGIHGGINLSKINSDFSYTSGGINYTDKQSSNLVMGPLGGVHAEISLGGNFYLQPEISYSRLGGQTTYQAGADSTSERFKLKGYLHYLVLPVLIKYKIPKTGVGIYAGPQYGYLLGTSNKINNTTINEPDNSNYKNDIAGIAGAEYYFPFGLGISARYQLGFSNIQKPEYFDTGTLPMGVVAKSISVRNTAFTFTIGYRF